MFIYSLVLRDVLVQILYLVCSTWSYNSQSTTEERVLAVPHKVEVFPAPLAA